MSHILWKDGVEVLVNNFNLKLTYLGTDVNNPWSMFVHVFFQTQILTENDIWKKKVKNKFECTEIILNSHKIL